MTVKVLHFSDPACPWAYSASPALAALQWRFGDQLDWELITITLSEDASVFESRPDYTPTRVTIGRREYRERFGMPFGAEPRERNVISLPACRAIVATRLRHPGREHAVLRALQFAFMTTTLLVDTEDGIRAAIVDVEGIDADAIISSLEAPDVVQAWQDDYALTRTAAGSATEVMGRSSSRGGAVRYTAPSLLFERDNTRLDAGGFQPLEAYDVCLANLAPELERRPEPETAAEALTAFPDGLTTREVAAVMQARLGRLDHDGAEASLIEAVADGKALRRPLGNDALWQPA
jgi:predicted DsbA family dithiol-disulfide isomerase